MEDINIKQFRYAQPTGQVEQPSDPAYLKLANRLLHAWDKSGIMPDVHDDLKTVVCLGLLGYYQDIITDAGVWRSFIDECKRLYGNYVPFHEDNEEYILYELNRADVEFVLWYQLAFNSMQFRYISPQDRELLRLADRLYRILEDEYDEIVEPEDYTAIFDCELHDPESTMQLYDLGQWLFWKNWLMVPPFQLTYAQIYSQLVEIQQTAPDPETARKQIDEIREQAMTSLPTGPLALYLREWLSLILEGQLPKSKSKTARNDCAEAAAEGGEHPYFTAFIKATNGARIHFLKTYEDLNRFFIEALGWAKGEEHLPQMKGHQDFVLCVTPDKGMMVAKNIAKCIAHPANPLYDREHARKFAINLLTQRAVCPGDMLRYICRNGWLPDAQFPERPSLTQAKQPHDTTQLVAQNWDFIARAYLQEYYRGD